MEKTEKPDKYKIETLEDILEIPSEHFDQFLEELKYIHLVYNKIKKQNPASKVKIADTYWPDGKHKIVRFTVEY